MLRRSTRRGELGEGKLGLVIAIVLVLFCAHVGLKFIPMKIKTAEFNGKVEDGLRSVATGQMKRDQYIDSILLAAKEADIGLREADIDFQHSGNRVSVSIEYAVTLDMIWGEWVTHGSVSSDLPTF